jgi:hypothetical protein
LRAAMQRTGMAPGECAGGRRRRDAARPSHSARHLAIWRPRMAVARGAIAPWCERSRRRDASYFRSARGAA